MSLQLYNTASRQKEKFSKDGIVTAYTCGLTVYSNPHIGNWRTFIFYDTLMRVLRLNDFDVRDVQNITDVGHLVSDEDEGEDKLEKQAKLQKRTAWEVAAEYTDVLFRGMNKLNIETPYKMPKATDHIAEQIDMVKRLDEKGYTYKIDDGVYFDTSKFADYGKTLLGKNAKADKAFARIGENDQKRNPEDFALWKFSNEGEKRDMEWDSPWGVGFPGWHLECSAMARKYLGDTIDIHAGGIDHIPVHHTNEIAQSEAANNAPFAQFWLHGEFILADGSKMSKSTGNVYTLDDIEAKGFTPMDFRMLILQGHYRTETNFSWDNLQNAHNRLNNLYSAAERRWQLQDNAKGDIDIDSISSEFMNSLNNDLNTPKALEAVASVLSAVSMGIGKSDVQAFTELLQLMDRALGLEIINSTPDISDEQKKAIQERDKAKESKDYDSSDKIRDQLLEQGIEVLDGPSGSIWQRKR